MPEYFTSRKIRSLPRLPLEGKIDLTYRCNNNCRHCWLRIPADSPEGENEITLEEIKRIVEDAKSMGCRKWFISGGEPMVRSDFAEVFDYITQNSFSYTLNTNGTLITPEIARLMKRKGSKLVAFYGATADVHDRITRNQGSFEALMQGVAYLREADAEFTVQIVPMKDNYHQYHDMVKLAESLSPHWRVGASWLWLSACGEPAKNKEIISQRLTPKEVVELDKPDLSYEEWVEEEQNIGCFFDKNDDFIFDSCIKARRDFHIDPYGGMSFCGFIQERPLRYDLRKGSFKDGWDTFIPSLGVKLRGGEEYRENCGSCDFRKDCRWCPVYGYLEHRKYSAKVDYLCAIAIENRKYKANWRDNHRRYYQIAGITIQVESDLPINEDSFHSKFKLFEVEGPGEDTIHIRHHFFLPDLKEKDLGKQVYRKAPWAIYRKDDSWIYLVISPGAKSRVSQLAVSNAKYTRVNIYNPDDGIFKRKELHSLTSFPTDQIILAQVLADRNGCYFHSSGVILNNKGLLFIGHSEAGKSTMLKMFKDMAEPLCDDRIIIRHWLDGFRIHGTWSHGEVPIVSAKSAPLKAIFFLEKSDRNFLVNLEDTNEITRKLIACLIKGLETANWWEKMLMLMEKLARTVPCYTLHFDKSGRVVDLLRNI